jgi:hypothetical protein
MQQPSKDSAIASFVLGLLCVIPWLNWGISLLAMYFGYRAIYLIRKYPDRYTGLWYAIAGATLGTATLVLNILGLLFCARYAIFPGAVPFC